MVVAAEDHIVVKTCSSTHEPLDEITQVVALTRTPCHLGGTRPWMHCPCCHCRVLLLYLGPYDFRCRHCWRLTYESRNEGQLDLQFRRERNARNKLGAPADLTVPITPRSKWKHGSKYERLRKEAELQQQKVIGLMNKKLQAPMPD